jgi:hypothetical protein
LRAKAPRNHSTAVNAVAVRSIGAFFRSGKASLGQPRRARKPPYEGGLLPDRKSEKLSAVLDTPEAVPCLGWASTAIGGPSGLPGQGAEAERIILGTCAAGAAYARAMSGDEIDALLIFRAAPSDF